MDLLLMLLNDEDRCSLDEARQHPLLRTDAEVMDLLEQLCNFFNDKSVAISSTTSPLKFRVMQSLELYRKGDEKSNREVTFVIASLPFGLRQLHTENRHFGYLDLVVGRDAAKARNTEFDRYGWSSTLPTTVANSLHGLHRENNPNLPKKNQTDPSTRLKGSDRDRPKYLFSVVELIINLYNVYKHQAAAQPTERAVFVANMLRKNYPFLLSHIWHVLSYFKDELKAANGLYKAAF